MDISEQRQAAAEKRKAAMLDSVGEFRDAARKIPPRLAERSGEQGGKPWRSERGQMDRYLAFPSEMRAKTEERDGKKFSVVEGTASVFSRGYDMWDEFGPYVEDVAAGAADATLAAKPDVVFLINHRGLAMARTGGPWNGNSSTLELSADAAGLHDVAWLNPERADVKDLLHAVDDKVVTEQSFAFQIDDGEWAEDFSTYTIKRFDLNRGDVSAVNYGANPYTTIAARQQEILTDLRLAGPGTARAALHELQQRTDLGMEELTQRVVETHVAEQREAASQNRSVAHLEALLLSMEN